MGAGFSRNWGGWLANEAFEYLICSKEISGNAELLKLLWNHKCAGTGFEGALQELQEQYQASPNVENKKLLDILQGAILQMFRDMNDAFEKMTGLEFANPPEVGKRVSDLLAKFDAIFTLNQDLLLEQHYKRSGRSFHYPGIKRPAPLEFGVPLSQERWSVSAAKITEPSGGQSIYKLHGSSNWFSSSGEPMLVMGGGQVAAIQSNDVLSRYRSIFAKMLATTDARLTVIGYSFGDQHINELILKGAETGLRVFVIDPLGSDVVNGNAETKNRFEDMMIGGSRRSLTEAFGGSDEVARRKVMRFFDV